MFRISLLVAACTATVALAAFEAVAQPYGSYQETCRRIQKRGPILYAHCRTRDGSWAETSLDLRACFNRNVSNRNGRLVCPGGRGDRSR